MQEEFRALVDERLLKNPMLVKFNKEFRALVDERLLKNPMLAQLDSVQQDNNEINSQQEMNFHQTEVRYSLQQEMNFPQTEVHLSPGLEFNNNDDIYYEQPNFQHTSLENEQDKYREDGKLEDIQNDNQRIQMENQQIQNTNSWQAGALKTNIKSGQQLKKKKNIRKKTRREERVTTRSSFGNNSDYKSLAKPDHNKYQQHDMEKPLRNTKGQVQQQKQMISNRQTTICFSNQQQQQNSTSLEESTSSTTSIKSAQKTKKEKKICKTERKQRDNQQQMSVSNLIEKNHEKRYKYKTSAKTICNCEMNCDTEKCSCLGRKNKKGEVQSKKCTLSCKCTNCLNGNESKMRRKKENQLKQLNVMKGIKKITKKVNK